MKYIGTVVCDKCGHKKEIEMDTTIIEKPEIHRCNDLDTGIFRLEKLSTFKTNEE